MTDKHSNSKAEKKPLSRMEMRKLKKEEEMKKKRNVYDSRRSSEETGGFSSYGATAYEESTGKFAGGDVRTRTRVSMIGRPQAEATSKKGPGRPGFAMGMSNKNKNPFAKSQKAGKSVSNNTVSQTGKTSPPGAGGGRPLGF
ncbi:hypothetical protein GF382_01530 [Candidatus Falkowbacteria bacterium]|nr:hypothetical protein [Candidatus Falkowbacteria bacterium]